MTTLVSGSIAYDFILTYPGRFREQIMADKSHILNISFLADSLDEHFGGTAGNIAYNLSLLGEDSTLFGTVGNDFARYRQHCEDKGIDLSGVAESEDIKTAFCYITTDLEDNQITGFFPGAMGRSVTNSIGALSNTQKINLAIFAPDDPAAMVQHTREARELGIPFILDIGQQVASLEKEQINHCLLGARYLVGNDYEIELVQRKTGLTIGELLKQLEAVIVTKGKDGSTIYTNQKQYAIDAVSTVDLQDPTGAGDAYRAGLIIGINRKLDWQQTGQLASTIAAYAVEHKGTQNHYFDWNVVKKRYTLEYGNFRDSI